MPWELNLEAGYCSVRSAYVAYCTAYATSTVRCRLPGPEGGRQLAGNRALSSPGRYLRSKMASREWLCHKEEK